MLIKFVFADKLFGAGASLAGGAESELAVTPE